MPRYVFAALALLAGAPADSSAQYRDWRDVPAALRAAAPRGTGLTFADTVHALPPLAQYRVIRATIFACFDCADIQMAYVTEGPDSFVIRSATDLARMWPAPSEPAPSSLSLLDQAIALVRLTCVPGCGPQLTSSLDDYSQDSRLFVGPADSMAAIRPPADTTLADGSIGITFFLRTSTGTYRVLLLQRPGRVPAIRMSWLAGYMGG